MADILDELIGGGVAPADLAAALRRQMEYGTAGALSGSKRLAPVGGALREEAIGQATDYRNRADKKAANEAANAMDALRARMAAADKAADRAQRAADAAANRALQRDLASMREAGADRRAVAKAKGKAPVALTPDQLEAQANEFDKLSGIAGEGIKRTGMLSAGLGSLTKVVPGLPAHNLDQFLEPLRSNLALTALADLKAASKTGASGLGQVTEREIDLLMSKIASLKTSQSPEQLRDALAEVQKNYATLAAKLRQGQAEAADALSGADEPVEVPEDDITSLMQGILSEHPELAAELESLGG